MRIVIPGIRIPEQAAEAAAEEEYTESKVRFTEDGMLILPRPVRKGKVFIEWNTREDGIGTGYRAGEIIDPADIVLYSIWRDAPEEDPEENRGQPAETGKEGGQPAETGKEGGQPESGIVEEKPAAEEGAEKQ